MVVLNIEKVKAAFMVGIGMYKMANTSFKTLDKNIKVEMPCNARNEVRGTTFGAIYTRS